jgi:hypothetical protein
MMSVLLLTFTISTVQAQSPICQELLSQFQQTLAYYQQQILALKQKIEAHQCASINCEQERDELMLKVFQIQQIYDVFSDIYRAYGCH